MPDVMAELRAEAAKRAQQREAAERRFRETEQLFMEMDRKPERRAPAAVPESTKSASRPSVASTSAGVGPSGSDGTNLDTVVETAEINLPLCGCGMPDVAALGDSVPGRLGGQGEPIGQHIFAMVGLHPPSEASFHRHFKEWFEEEYFPHMSAKLQQELVARAKTKGFFSGLSSQVKKWAMANTDARLQAEVWFAYFREHAALEFRTYGCLCVATVNLGSVAFPCWTRFLGYKNASGEHWSLSPFTSVDADIGAVLDELDGRGGMTALLAAA